MCKICYKETPTFRSLSHHISMHNITILEYYIKYENFEIPKCPHCGKDCKLIKNIKFYKTCCNSECVEKQLKSKKYSEETKIKISNSIIRF